MKSWPISNEKIRSVIISTRNSEVLMVCHLISMVCRKFINRVTLFDLYAIKAFGPDPETSRFTVENSLDFCDQIKHVKLEDDDELVSFDVVSLFT